jgi:hypothetical protein
MQVDTDWGHVRSKLNFPKTVCFLPKVETLCTLAETKIGRLVYANGRLSGTVVTITFLFIFIAILLTVRLPTHSEQTKSACAITYLCVKKLYYA